MVAATPADEHKARTAESELTDQLVTASGEECRRIAREIHDDSIQAITALGMRSQILQRSLTDPAQLSVLAELEKTMQLSIARLRRVADDLAPPGPVQDRLTSRSVSDTEGNA
jgi:signal transduction histidine kinase